MKQLPSIGPNRTGMDAAPQRAVDMLEGCDMFPPLAGDTKGDSSRQGPGAAVMQEERIEYAREGKHGIGSVPPPQSQDQGPTEPRTVLLLDKLGERIAVERMGTRLYDALLAKHQAHGSFDGGPSERDLEEIRMQRHEHIATLHEVIDVLGGDPTAVTPSADLAGVVGRGINQVLTDPRTNLVQCLEALIMAELANRHGWDTLVALAHLAGLPRVAERLELGQINEREHVDLLAGWIASAYGHPGEGG